MNSVKKQWLRLTRWAFRMFGGFHHTEHAEIVWAAEVLAEKETAQLRLADHHWRQRHGMLSRMLNKELV